MEARRARSASAAVSSPTAAARRRAGRRVTSVHPAIVPGGSPATSPGTEQVHHKLAAVRRDERRAQDPGLDQPRPGGRIALTDQGPAGPDDREGEWFDDGHRRWPTRTTPPAR
jgi:hypothetical protein